MGADRRSDLRENFTIAILGAGSLGQLWAGYLPPSATVFLTRPNSTANKADHDLLKYQLRRPDGTELSCTVPCLDAGTINPSLLLVTTKAGDTLTALGEQLPELPKSMPIVLFQNGMGSQSAVAHAWPDHPILAASTTEGAHRPRSDVLVHAGRGQTWVGGFNPAGLGYAEEVTEQLKTSGLSVHRDADIRSRLWEKLVVNAGINAFTAILDCPNADILHHPYFLEHIDALSHEISKVMATEIAQPLSPETIKERIEFVAISTASNTSSMRSDRQRGRRTEIRVINGYLVAKGLAAGIPTPVNRMLSEQVKDLTEAKVYETN